MKSKTNKKIGLAAMLTALLGLPVKSLGESSDELRDYGWKPVDLSEMQPMYGIPYAGRDDNDSITDGFRFFDLFLILITFIVGIISFLKIRKIKDKVLRRKKIICSLCIIVVLILVILLVLQYIWMRDNGVSLGTYIS